MNDDIPDHIQDLFIGFQAKLEAAGLGPIEAVHHHIAFGLAMLPVMVCREHLFAELAHVDDALARLRGRLSAGAH
jgi:hypothetical protein